MKKREDAGPLLIGAHTSIAGGLYKALLEGASIGATTIQIFTANQRRWDSLFPPQAAIDDWKRALAETGIREVMSHDSYLINLGAPNEENLVKSRKTFKTEIERCLVLGLSYLNFHPGAALDAGEERCLNTIVESLLENEKLLEGAPLKLLIECTAGQGSVVGCKFSQIGYIIERVKHKIPIGVCLDTCHLFAAGYDVRSQEGWNATLQAFDDEIGLKFLNAFHLNDSMHALGSRRDRHADLGTGEIGIGCFKTLMRDPRTKSIPKYLETPGGPERWKVEIQMLREFAETKE